MRDNPASGVVGAIIAALLASLCCLGPLVLLSLGISGAWMGSLSVLEPYRPLLVAVTIIFLGFAFYQVYRRPKAAAGATGPPCVDSRARTIQKTMLWMVTVLIAGLLAFPYIAPRLLATASGTGLPGDERIVLVIERMHCDNCPVTIRRALLQLPGVRDAHVTLEPPEAIVIYDPEIVSIRDMTEATVSVGYPSSPKTDGS
jgi:copper chaperone CopZ